MEEKHKKFMRMAIALSKEGMQSCSGGPFGAIIVKDDEVIARGYNKVTSTHDPTAHAEMVAIREACAKLGTFQLDDCILYTSCEPCPMCLGAIYWARPKAVYYGCDKKDAAKIDFDDDFIYQEIAKEMKDRKIQFVQVMQDEAQKVFELWAEKEDKVEY